MGNNFVLPSHAGTVRGTDEHNKIAVERQKIKKEAYKALRDYISKLDNLPELIQDALTATERATGGGFRTNPNSNVNKIAELFTKVGDELSEGSIFTEFKLGRAEMRGIIKTLITKKSLYLDFNPETGVYKLVGKDKEPKGWNGYKPKATKIEHNFDDVQIPNN